MLIKFHNVYIFFHFIRLQDKWQNKANSIVNDAQEKSNKDRNNENIYKTDSKSQNDDDTRSILAKQRPWYFAGGEKNPNSAKIDKRVAKLLPSEDPLDDRITNQLMFIPSNYEEIRESGRLKTILLYSGQWDTEEGRDVFVKNKCPVDTCTITHQRDAASTADLIIYKDSFLHTGVSRPPNQLYMLYLLESPYHTSHISSPDVFNWTATYRYSCLESKVLFLYEKCCFCFEKATFFLKIIIFFSEKTVQLLHPMRNGYTMIQKLNKSSNIEIMLQIKPKKSLGLFQIVKHEMDEWIMRVNYKNISRYHI